jgi:hypothetical protein
VEDEPFECLATLRHDEEADRRAAGNERLLDRPTSGHELLARVDEADGRRRRTMILRGGPWSVRSIAAGGPRSCRAIERSCRAIERSCRAIRRALVALAWPIPIRPIGVVPEIRPIGSIVEWGPRLTWPIGRSTAIHWPTRRRPGAARGWSSPSWLEGSAAARARSPIEAAVRCVGRWPEWPAVLAGVGASAVVPSTIRP